MFFLHSRIPLILSTKYMAKPWMDISVEMRDGMVQWPGDPVCRVGLT